MQNTNVALIALSMSDDTTYSFAMLRVSCVLLILEQVMAICDRANGTPRWGNTLAWIALAL